MWEGGRTRRSKMWTCSNHRKIRRMWVKLDRVDVGYGTALASILTGDGRGIAFMITRPASIACLVDLGGLVCILSSVIPCYFLLRHAAMHLVYL